MKDNTLTLETFIVLFFSVLRHEIVKEKMMNKTSKNRRDSFRFFFDSLSNSVSSNIWPTFHSLSGICEGEEEEK